ncbi:hypothetical protein A9Q91_03710 [Candidatus Gracilibacteria bacterium 28_42_T64]|nr:hypothetical protein A9Q91_03710 [Candidatus Gracilibacteria bacterium 28_42_T64]
MKADNELLEKLVECKTEEYSGKIHKDSFLQIGLDFSAVKVIAPQILNGPHFMDWIGSKGWPEGYIPLAVYSTTNDEQEEILMDASRSDSEEFFAVKQDEESYPVYMWSHSAGLSKRADSLEEFLGELS